MGRQTLREIDTHASATMDVRKRYGVDTRSATQPVIGDWCMFALVSAIDVSSFKLVITSSTGQPIRLRTTQHQVVTPTAEDPVTSLLAVKEIPALPAADHIPTRPTPHDVAVFGADHDVIAVAAAGLLQGKSDVVVTMVAVGVIAAAHDIVPVATEDFALLGVDGDRVIATKGFDDVGLGASGNDIIVFAANDREEPVNGVMALAGDCGLVKIDSYSAGCILVDENVFVLLLATALGGIKTAMKLIVAWTALDEVTLDEHGKAVSAAVNRVVATPGIDDVHATTTTQPIIATETSDRVLSTEPNDHISSRRPHQRVHFRRPDDRRWLAVTGVADSQRHGRSRDHPR